MTFIIAEMSANHGGSIDKAKEMIMAAKWAGCHAVKFQLYRKEDLPNTYDPALHVEVQTMIYHLGRYCQSAKIPMVVSVFSWWAIEYLAGSAIESRLPIHALKFASPQSTRLKPEAYKRMVRLIKEHKRQLWISSGFVDWHFMNSLGADLMFFCPPGHPATLDEIAIPMVKGRGFSDHTEGIIQTLAAIKAGATHIEKHFMLDENCVDAAFSINPDQMKMLCDLGS